MFLEKRPTCVTVIGWAWIIIGGLMILSAVMGLISWKSISDTVRRDPTAPILFQLFPLIAWIQMGIGGLGLVAGIHFLQFKPWSRLVLEALTWLLLVFMASFLVFWIYLWYSLAFSQPLDPDFQQMGTGFKMMFIVSSLLTIGIYGVPTLFMLKALRSARVRNAMNGLPESPIQPTTDSTAG